MMCEPSTHGDILAKERGGVKIIWKTSAGISSFIDDKYTPPPPEKSDAVARRNSAFGCSF